MTGMSPLPTHEAMRIIHVESNAARNFTLDEFLETWNELDINGILGSLQTISFAVITSYSYCSILLNGDMPRSIEIFLIVFVTV